MRIDFDLAKSDKNGHDRGLPFERAAEFEWDSATFVEDERNQYPERRFVAVGYLEKRLHVICFTPVPGGVRIISFRKANVREAKNYGKKLTID
ncbi:MAG: BrnT family toxin [Desulfosalsimonadaceae bacterium]|nr:BrnT family toxin [Desulfosalsimonadaceae bacterium]